MLRYCFPPSPPATMLLLQDYGGDDRARAAIDEEWRFFEVSLALLAAATPLLLFRLLRAAASFLPELGPTVKVSKHDRRGRRMIRTRTKERVGALLWEKIKK